MMKIAVGLHIKKLSPDFCKKKSLGRNIQIKAGQRLKFFSLWFQNQNPKNF